MNGKLVAGFLVVTALVAGAVMYWLQVYAYYHPASFTPGEEIALTPIVGGMPEAILADDVTGIDADSSPLRFRACFTTPLSQAMLTETYRVYETPRLPITPGWFDCFDVPAIDAGLASGEAIAFLSVPEIHKGVDRVVAVFPDGRAYAWQQLNGSLEK